MSKLILRAQSVIWGVLFSVTAESCQKRSLVSLAEEQRQHEVVDVTPFIKRETNMMVVLGQSSCWWSSVFEVVSPSFPPAEAKLSSRRLAAALFWAFIEQDINPLDSLLAEEGRLRNVRRNVHKI